MGIPIFDVSQKLHERREIYQIVSRTSFLNVPTLSNAQVDGYGN